MISRQDWQSFLAKLKKDKNPLYELLKDSNPEEKETEVDLYFPTEAAKEAARAKLPNIQSQISKYFPHCKSKKIKFVIGNLPPEPTTKNLPGRRLAEPQKFSNPKLSPNPATQPSPKFLSVRSPLQALNFTLFDEHSQPALEAAAKADETCESLYQFLTQKTQRLADDTLSVQFPWRVRVGGMRGFRELLLPVFHPVYGVPYIPSSSLKGAARAWAKKNQQNLDRVNRLLGTLDEGIGSVQILDAFPTEPCLSIDMANPQWSWTENRVRYQPVPHALLSMEQPELVIGLIRTSRGRKKDNVQQDNEEDDLQTIKGWLEKALAAGIGSRVSAGYGRRGITAGLPYSSCHRFKLWSQGMYGASTQNPEFRPVALRGMLRYWFRAIALGLYDTDTCKTLETRLFGALSHEGSIRIGVEYSQAESDRPFQCSGTILLEAKYQSDLALIEKVLHLSSLLSGIGRGSRRPLHWNSGRMRGCHWEVDGVILPCNQQAWQDFLQGVRDAFLTVQRLQNTPDAGNPGSPGNRYQDVLNTNARIYLVPCPGLRHPKSVKNWSTEGIQPSVLGQALKLLYSDNNFKGQNRQGNGNPLVGGKLGTPSYVLIKSNFPNSGQPYQTVTIFGVEHPKRTAFANALPAGSLILST